jgi:molecular chaperone GrpE
MMSLLLIALVVATAASIAWALWERRRRREARTRLEEETEQLRREATGRIRRLERDLKEARETGHLDFAEELMDAVDTLERARREMPDEEGVTMVERSIIQSFRRFGLEPIDPQRGDTFDPEQHEAWSTREVSAEENRDVCEVHRRGWTFQDRVLRPAAVTVGVHEEVVLDEPDSDAGSDPDLDDVTADAPEEAVQREAPND